MKESTMLVKNFDNEILELKGNLINTDSESTWYYFRKYCYSCFLNQFNCAI